MMWLGMTIVNRDLTEAGGLSKQGPHIIYADSKYRKVFKMSSKLFKEKSN